MGNYLKWRDLKKFVNLLTDEELEQNVISVDERGTSKAILLEKLSEDNIDCSGEGYEPISVYKDEEYYGDLLSDTSNPRLYKGSIILWSTVDI